MKRAIAVLLSAALLLSLLPACRSGEVPSPAPSGPAESDAAPDPSPSAPEEPLQCAEIMTSIWAGLDLTFPGAESLYSELGPSEGYSSEPERLSAYIEGAYGLSQGEWEAAAIARATGASALELAVLRFAGEEAALHGEDCLREYLHTREGDFTGYAPDQARLAAEGSVCRQGRYVGLFILEESARAQAQASFAEILETGQLPEPTPTPEPVTDAAGVLAQYLELLGQTGENTSGLERVDGGDPDRLKAIVEEEYGLADYPWTDAAVARGTDGNAFELAILRMDTGLDTAMDAVETLNAYLDAREESFSRFPAQKELLHDAIAAWSEGYIVLLVCDTPVQRAAWLGGITGAGSGFSTMRRHMEPAPAPSAEPDPEYPDRVQFNPPNEEDMSIYDTSAIRAAWDQGDPSALSQYDRAVYDSAERVLNEVLADGMSDLEKETAIYRWLVDNVDYDWRHQDIMAQTPRSAYEPYGGLVDRMAVCLGYAASFQLLCDLAGVECITVVGAAFENDGDHAWNMVRLDGAWYCVDVTWDANGREQLGGRYGQWRYFNITSDRMADTNHQWDYANTPEAVTEGQG